LDWWLGDGYKPGPIFDIWLITNKALERIRTGTEPEEAGAVGEHQNGNGSLMRILPIALVGHQATDAQLVEMAMRASSITHGHPRSRVSCAVTFSQPAICCEETRSGLTPWKRHLMASG